jgi:hypothetical protein
MKDTNLLFIFLFFFSPLLAETLRGKRSYAEGFTPRLPSAYLYQS